MSDTNPSPEQVGGVTLAVEELLLTEAMGEGKDEGALCQAGPRRARPQDVRFSL